jgi:urease accessory protein
MSSALRMGVYRYLTTFYVCKVGLEVARWIELERLLRVLAIELSVRGEVLWGVSTLAAHGLAIRGLSVSSRRIAPGLLAFWQAAKDFLYACPAVMPRKIY